MKKPEVGKRLGTVGFFSKGSRDQVVRCPTLKSLGLGTMQVPLRMLNGGKSQGDAGGLTLPDSYTHTAIDKQNLLSQNVSLWHEDYFILFYFILFLKFTYLAAPGRSCGTRDLHCGMRDL